MLHWYYHAHLRRGPVGLAKLLLDDLAQLISVVFETGYYRYSASLLRTRFRK